MKNGNQRPTSRPVLPGMKQSNWAADMYQAARGVQPYPGRNKPPKMVGGSRGWGKQ